MTISGRLWPYTEVSDKYRLKPGDVGHALLALMVLAVVVLLDGNTLNCIFPQSDLKAVQKWLPVVAGVVCKICTRFPHKRHGIGYHHIPHSGRHGSGNHHNPDSSEPIHIAYLCKIYHYY